MVELDFDTYRKFSKYHGPFLGTEFEYRSFMHIEYIMLSTLLPSNCSDSNATHAQYFKLKFKNAVKIFLE